MIQQVLTTSFKTELLKGLHDFSASGGDSFKLALYADTATLNSTTTAYTTTGEVSATGYTAGGIALTNVEPAGYNTTGYTTFSNVSWSASITARGGLIYNSTNGNRSVMVLDFGMNRSSVSGVFAITFPSGVAALLAQTAIIRLQ